MFFFTGTCVARHLLGWTRKTKHAQDTATKAHCADLRIRRLSDDREAKAFGVPRLVAAKVAGGKVRTSRKKFTEVFFFFSSDERRGDPRGHPAEDITARHFGRRQARCRRSHSTAHRLCIVLGWGSGARCSLQRDENSTTPRPTETPVERRVPPCSQNFVNSQFFRGEVLNSSDIRAVNVARE